VTVVKKAEQDKGVCRHESDQIWRWSPCGLDAARTQVRRQKKKSGAGTAEANVVLLKKAKQGGRGMPTRCDSRSPAFRVDGIQTAQ